MFPLPSLRPSPASTPPSASSPAVSQPESGIERRKLQSLEGERASREAMYTLSREQGAGRWDLSKSYSSWTRASEDCEYPIPTTGAASTISPDKQTNIREEGCTVDDPIPPSFEEMATSAALFCLGRSNLGAQCIWPSCSGGYPLSRRRGSHL